MQKNVGVKLMFEVRFKLNEKNEKDAIIINLFKNEYNPNEVIKGVLYKIALSVNEGQPITLSGGVNVMYNPDGNIISVNQVSISGNKCLDNDDENGVTDVNEGKNEKVNENEEINVSIGNDLAKMFNE